MGFVPRWQRSDFPFDWPQNCMQTCHVIFFAQCYFKASITNSRSRHHCEGSESKGQISSSAGNNIYCRWSTDTPTWCKQTQGVRFKGASVRFICHIFCLIAKHIKTFPFPPIMCSLKCAHRHTPSPSFILIPKCTWSSSGDVQQNWYKRREKTVASAICQMFQESGFYSVLETEPRPFLSHTNTPANSPKG